MKDVMSDGAEEVEINEGGRPTKYKEEYDEQAYKLCLLGSTDKELASFFEVAESTINLWKLEHEGFSESIKRGKVSADANIAQRLYMRAFGVPVVRQQAYKMKDSYYDDSGKKVETERIEVVDLLQEQAPDTTAAIFWLKNRSPELWRDKPEPTDDGDVPPVKVVIQVEDARDHDRTRD